MYALRSDATDDEPVALVETEFAELMPRLSPDGWWLAYMSDESGQPEVYVRPFPNTADAMVAGLDQRGIPTGVVA